MDNSRALIAIWYELIEKFKDNWDWENLSRNELLPWSMELIERFKDKWNSANWKNLSKNESLPWSIELIERFKDNWDWWELSQNKSLSWSIELIEKLEDKCGIPCNKKVYDLIIPEIEKVMPMNDFLESLD